jgi:hypothetical protein
MGDCARRKAGLFTGQVGGRYPGPFYWECGRWEDWEVTGGNLLSLASRLSLSSDRDSIWWGRGNDADAGRMSRGPVPSHPPKLPISPVEADLPRRGPASRSPTGDALILARTSGNGLKWPLCAPRASKREAQPKSRAPADRVRVGSVPCHQTAGPVSGRKPEIRLRRDVDDLGPWRM